MIKLQGIGVSPGIGMGNILIKKEPRPAIARRSIKDGATEIERLAKAQKEAIGQLGELYEKALLTVGKSEAQIFEVHQMILADQDFLGRIKEIIEEERINAESATQQAAEEFAALFANMDDSYLQERAADLKDIANRLLRLLMGIQEDSLAHLPGPVILAARDLLPSDTIDLDRQNVLAIVTEAGGETSHSSILARTMAIPAVVAVKQLLENLKAGDQVIVDGKSGEVIINPTLAAAALWRERSQERQKTLAARERLKGTASITQDGARIRVAANIGAPPDVENALANDAEGIGLFRSEYLYLGRETLPSEEVQFQAYKTVLQKMGNKPVIIRTLDAGGDKNIPYLQIPLEANPFLGYRAIRLCLDQPQILRTQIRALLRASVYGRLGIMFPMISTLEEVRRAKEIVAEVQGEMSSARVAFDPDLEIGVMIETPSAALISDQLAKEVDFFSIGTNDLIQYTLAVDRTNEKVAHLYNPQHPAVLRLIQMAITNGHREKIWVGICGEAAADLALTETFVAMGIDELSVNAGSVLEIREKIQGINAKQASSRLQI